MPATDYLMPAGLDWDELAELLAPLGASPALAGVSLACLNPEKRSRTGSSPSAPARWWPTHSAESGSP